MQFKEEYEYPAPIETVWKMFSDPTYAKMRAEKLQITDPEIKSNVSDTQIAVTTTGGIPQDMLPSAAKRFISSSAKAVFAEEWNRESAERISGSISVTAQGVPAELKGKAELTGHPDKTRVVLQGTVSVHIPLLGKRLEAEAVKFAPEIAKGEQQTSEEYLSSN